MITRVTIRPECAGCALCATMCPEVFRLDEPTGIAEVITDQYAAHENAILKAAAACPIQVIEVIRDGLPVGERFAPAIFQELKYLTANVIEVVLIKPGYPPLPGHFITLKLRDGKGTFYRPFSIVSYHHEVIRLCIKLYPGSRTAAALFSLTIGATIDISPPKGTFLLRTPDQPKLFVATGTGIAPLYALMEAAPEADKTLLFGVHSEADLIYLDSLSSLPKTRIIPVLSRSSSAWQGLKGRVTSHITQFTTPINGQKKEVYICGNPAMIQDVKSVLKTSGYPDPLVSWESYSHSREATSAPSSTDFKTVGAKPRKFNWLSWVRDFHFYLSLSLFGILFFYGMTGFIAINEDFFTKGDDKKVSEVHQQLPLDVPITQEALAAYFQKRHHGGFKARKYLDDGTTIYLEIESVWQNHGITLTKADRNILIKTRKAKFADTLIDLHKGDNVSKIQHWMISLTGIILMLVACSGVVYGFIGKPSKRKLILTGLVAGSLLLLLIMIVRR